MIGVFDKLDNAVRKHKTLQIVFWIILFVPLFFYGCYLTLKDGEL